MSLDPMLYCIPNACAWSLLWHYFELAVSAELACDSKSICAMSFVAKIWLSKSATWLASSSLSSRDCLHVQLVPVLALSLISICAAAVISPLAICARSILQQLPLCCVSRRNVNILKLVMGCWPVWSKGEPGCFGQPQECPTAAGRIMPDKLPAHTLPSAFIWYPTLCQVNNGSD